MSDGGRQSAFAPYWVSFLSLVNGASLGACIVHASDNAHAEALAHACVPVDVRESGYQAVAVRGDPNDPETIAQNAAIGAMRWISHEELLLRAQEGSMVPVDLTQLLVEGTRH